MVDDVDEDALEPTQPAAPGTRARYAISDPSVFELCDQVCGGLRRHITELDALLRSGE